MRLVVAGALFVLTLCAVPANAQQALVEADIRRTVPYTSMLRDNPTMTYDEYEAAVRAVARERVLEMSPTPYSRPLPRQYQPPSYTPPPVYLPPPTYVPPTSGHSYDWRSGNSYRWNRDSMGNTDVSGNNFGTGSNWRTRIKPNGSMTGTDKDFNMWTYDANSGFYMNYGTGRMCTGKGAARVCTGER